MEIISGNKYLTIDDLLRLMIKAKKNTGKKQYCKEVRKEMRKLIKEELKNFP